MVAPRLGVFIASGVAPSNDDQLKSMLVFAEGHKTLLTHKHDIQDLSDLSLNFNVTASTPTRSKLLTGSFCSLGSGAAVAQAADISRVACQRAIGQNSSVLRYVLYFSWFWQ